MLLPLLLLSLCDVDGLSYTLSNPPPHPQTPSPPLTPNTRSTPTRILVR